MYITQQFFVVKVYKGILTISRLLSNEYLSRLVLYMSPKRIFVELSYIWKLLRKNQFIL